MKKSTEVHPGKRGKHNRDFSAAKTTLAEPPQQNLNQGATPGVQPSQIPTRQIPEFIFHHLSLPPLTAEALANVVL